MLSSVATGRQSFAGKRRLPATKPLVFIQEINILVSGWYYRENRWVLTSRNEETFSSTPFHPFLLEARRKWDTFLFHICFGFRVGAKKYLSGVVCHYRSRHWFHVYLPMRKSRLTRANAHCIVEQRQTDLKEFPSIFTGNECASYIAKPPLKRVNKFVWNY